MSIQNEFQIKQERVRNFLKEHKLKGMLLSRQANFSWITCGGNDYVTMGSDLGVASVLITEKNNYIITNNIEAERLKEEEIKRRRSPLSLRGTNVTKQSICSGTPRHGGCPDSANKSSKLDHYSGSADYSANFKFISHMWYENEKCLEIIKKICPLDKLGTDAYLPGVKLFDSEFAKLRYSLTEEEIRRYEWLGAECGKSMGEVCSSIKSGDAENEIAARLSKELFKRGIVPTVLLVAADDRISKYRHPIPTEKKVKKYVMVVLCGRKSGLIVSLTRLVHFGKISLELRRKHNAVAQVDACFIGATRPGVNVSEIFKCAVQTYKKMGFANEWKLHHQGGATGYEGRDYKATLTSKEIVQEAQAFAWNPSITGTKSEDTIIALPKETKIISVVPNWPMISIECCGAKIKRPDILEK